MIFRVFPNQRPDAEYRDRQKQRACDFKPKLVRRVPKRTERSFRPRPNGIQRTIASGLLTGNACSNANLL